jgi:CheY-like chemotaxis protein
MAKILIIDDDPDIVLAVRLCLQGAGHEVFDARNSAEGLRKLEAIKPDLIILDVMMDSATEGFRRRSSCAAPALSPLAAYRTSHVLTAPRPPTTFAPDENICRWTFL